MPNVESKIVVNIKALVEGTGKVKDLASEVTGLESATGKASAGMSSATISGTKLDGMFGKLSTSTKGFAFAISGLGKKIEGEFAPLSAAGAKIDAFVRKEQAAIAQLERVKAQRAAVTQRDQFISTGQDPFAQGVRQFGETPLNKAGGQVASAQLTNNTATTISNLEKERASLRKLNDEAIRSGKDGSANINRLLQSFNQVDKVRSFERLLKDGSLLRTGLLRNVNAAAVLRGALTPLAPVARLITGVFATMVRQIQFAVAAFALFAAAAPAVGFGLLIKEGLQFNDVMERQRIGLAALIQSTHDLFNSKEPNKPLVGLAAYQAATIVAEAATQRLRIKIIPLRATSEELLPIFNQIVTAGSAAGLTLNQLEDTFVSLTSAAQILNIPTDRLGTEIRLLLSGTTRETSRLGPALFGTAAAAREFVKQHKAANDLFPALQQKLVSYNAALDASEQSYATLKENTLETFQILAGLATKGLFEKIKAGLQLITRGFFDLKAGKLKPEFEGLFNFLNDALTKFGAFLVELVGKIVGYVQTIAQYVAENRDYIAAILGDVVNIAQQLGGIVVDVLSIFVDLDRSRAATADWHTILGFAAITIGTIRDLLNIIIGVLQVVGSVVLDTFVAPLETALKLLGLFSDTAQQAANSIGHLRSGFSSFADSGAQRFAGGLDFLNGKSATDRFLNDPGITRTKPNANAADDIQSRLRKTSAAPSNKGASAADRLANRLGELKKRTADLLRQLYDSQVEIARAGEEKLFEIYKDSTSKQLTSLDVDLRHRLISYRDYYEAKSAIEQDQIAAERNHAIDNFEADKKLVQNKIDAIRDKFKALKAEPKNSAPAIQSELVGQESIEVQEQTNALRLKAIDLDKTLILLDSEANDKKKQSIQLTADALEEIGQKNATIQADLLESQGRETDAEIRRVAQQYRDTLRETLANNEPASAALKSVIEDIGLLGSVTTSEFNNLLDEAGLKFEELSTETKALIALMGQLEQKAKFKGLETQVGIATGNLGVRKDAIQDKVNLGVISEAKGRREIAAAEKETRLELERVIALMSALPGLTEQQKLAIAGLKQETSTLGREFDTVGNEINGVIASDLGNFFNTMLEGTDNLGQAFTAFISGMLIDIGKAIFQAIILKTILSALGLSKTGTEGAGSAGGIGGILSGIFGVGGKKAEGGEISGPGTGTSDSILARVSHGEWVIPAARVSQYGRGLMSALTKGTFGRMPSFAAGGPVDRSANPVAGFTGMRNINVLDPDLLSNYLTSSRGETTMINFISHNPGKVKRALGL